MAFYHPPQFVHPDRMGSAAFPPPEFLSLHTSEGGEGLVSAANLVAFQGAPGDRPDGDGGMYGSSYNFVADLGLKVWPCVPDNRQAFANRGANSLTSSIVIPGKANQTRAQWLDPTSREYILTAASWIHDQSVKYKKDYSKHLTDAEVQQAKPGYCDHAAISRAFHISGGHTDVGPNFPWDFLAESVAFFFKPVTPTDPDGPSNNPYLKGLDDFMGVMTKFDDSSTWYNACGSVFTPMKNVAQADVLVGFGMAVWANPDAKDTVKIAVSGGQFRYIRQIPRTYLGGAVNILDFNEVTDA